MVKKNSWLREITRKLVTLIPLASVNIICSSSYWAIMVLESRFELSIPSLRGNPFDGRPIESSRVNEIVGRDNILSSWAELIRSGSPRMLLLVGEKGSGKTSVINAVSTTTPTSIVCQYWPEENQLIKVLHEISVSLVGFEIPSTVHQISELLIRSLESKSGPLPLIALDFPSNVNMSLFLPRIIPILQRLRAFVIVSLTPSQFSNLETDILDVFDSPIHLSGLEKSNIQSLVDKRVQKKAKQRWILSEKILSLLFDNTSGNPRELINILQNLVDEHRGVGAKGSLEKLLGWNYQDNIQKDNRKEEDIIIENDHTVTSDQISDYFNVQEIDENDIVENINIVTPDEISDHFNFQEIEEDIEDNDKSHIQEVEVLEKISTENDDFTLINWGEDFEKLEYEDETIGAQEDNSSDSTWKEKENILQEFPNKSNKDHFGAFGGMISRSREVPKKYSKVDEMANEEYIDASINVIEESIVRGTFVSEEVKNNNKFHEQRKIEKHDDKLVFDTEGEVWTVDKKNEQTLPKNPYSNEVMISQDTILQEPAFDESMFETIIPEKNLIESEVHYEVENVIEKSSIIKSKITLSPKWDADEPFNSEYASQLSDTEILIVSKAMEREISPSDSELQALLQVGRPRLSQLYNALNKAGILSVRKKGRSRLFRISESAQSYF